MPDSNALGNWKKNPTPVDGRNKGEAFDPRAAQLELGRLWLGVIQLPAAWYGQRLTRLASEQGPN
jgi:hypothetical protein